MKNALRLAVTAIVVLFSKFANAQNGSKSSGSGFSFAVYGDSRSMMYLPYKEDQKDSATRLMVDLFSLIFPEKYPRKLLLRMSD
jgi:hypothetical protein